MEHYPEPQIFAAAAIRPFVISPINQRAFVGSSYDFTGLFDDRNFLAMENYLSGEINAVKFIVIERPDQCELVLKEDGTVVRPPFHQIAAKYSVNDIALYKFCKDNRLQKHIAGMLEVAVCVCGVCGDNGPNKVFDFCRNFNFGNCGLFTDKNGLKTGPVIGVECHMTSDTCSKLVTAILEGLMYRRSRFEEMKTNIAKVKIFNFFPFGKTNKDKPKLSKLAYFEMESLNNVICDDGLSQMSIVYRKSSSSLYGTGVSDKEITLTGKSLKKELELYKNSRALPFVPNSIYSSTDFPRVESDVASTSAASSSAQTSKIEEKAKKE